jgi:hypothetical protein
VNVPQVIGAVISSRLATMVELDTVLGAEDAYDLLEIVSVDAHNKRIASRSED